jgi:peptidoglycan-associated lipoprotein
MRKFIAPFLALWGLIAIISCSPKNVAPQTDQSSAATEQTAQKTDDKQQTKTEAVDSRDMSKESITERQVKADASDMRSFLKELEAKVKDIHFGYDKYDVPEDARLTLKEVASILSSNKKIKVIIEGHTDERGTNEYNLGLGDRRAASVRDYLVTLGIPSGRADTISYGEEKPLCAEQTESCWAKNRRAHFVFVEDLK